MPFVRCRSYNDDGNGHCPHLGSCTFVHPSERGWDLAQPRGTVTQIPTGPKGKTGLVTGSNHVESMKTWGSSGNSRSSRYDDNDNDDKTRPPIRANPNPPNSDNWNSSFGGGSAPSGWGSSSASAWGQTTSASCSSRPKSEENAGQSGLGNPAGTQSGWGSSSASVWGGAAKTSSSWSLGGESSTAGGWGNTLNTTTNAGLVAEGNRRSSGRSEDLKTIVSPQALAKESSRASGWSDPAKSFASSRPLRGDNSKSSGLGNATKVTTSSRPIIENKSKSTSFQPPAEENSRSSETKVSSRHSGESNSRLPETRGKELTKGMVSILANAVEAKTKRRDAEIKLQKYKVVNTSKQYGSSSRLNRKILDKIIHDLEGRVQFNIKKEMRYIEELAELPKLDTHPQLMQVSSQLKELRESIGGPVKHRRGATYEASLNAKAQARFDSLKEKMDDLETGEISESRVWDAISNRVIRMVDDFLVKRQHEEDDLAKEELKRQTEKANSAANDELSKQAEDIALVIERQTEAERLLFTHEAELEERLRIHSEMKEVDRCTKELLAQLQHDTELLREQVQQLSANTIDAPVEMADVEQRMRVLAEEYSTATKTEILESFQTSMRELAGKLQEHHDKLAKAIWPLIQKPLKITDEICNWYSEDNADSNAKIASTSSH